MNARQRNGAGLTSGWIALRWVSGSLCLLAACQGLPADSLVDAGGITIRQTAIDEITSSTELTEAQKRQALRDLGITDEQLIEALIQG